MRKSSASANCFQGIAHYLAASSLPPKETCKAVRALYCQQLEKAMTCLDEVRNKDEFRLLASLLWLEVIYCRIRVMGFSKDVSLIRACNEVVTAFIESEYRPNDKLHLKLWDYLQLLMTKVESHFSLNGDYVKAAKAAHWHLRLSQIFGYDENSASWYSARTVTCLKRIGLTSLAFAVLDTNHCEQSPSQTRGSPCIMESRIAKIRLEGAISLPEKLHHYVSELHLIADEVEEETKNLWS
jgi:hypothetical protein